MGRETLWSEDETRPRIDSEARRNLSTMTVERAPCPFAIELPEAV